MGGKIRVESELDKGSCFSFELSFQINTVDDKDTANAFDFEAQQVFVLTPNIDKLPNIKAALMGWGVKFASDPSVDVLVEKLSLDLASGGARSVIMLDTKLPDVAIAVQRIRDETGDREPVFLYVADQGIASAVELPIPLAELESSADETLLFRALRLRLAGTFVGRAESLDGDDDRLDGRSTARNLSVLLVEDNSVNRKVITKIISRAGHRVVTVIDGDAALDVLDAQKFDIILMDVNIPGLSGPETTKHYRFAHMGEDYVPIIALTADATLETRQQCIDAGMDTVVTKPVEARTLIDVVETFALRYGAQSTPDKDSTVGKVARSPKPSAARSNASAGSGAASVSCPPLRVVTDTPINPKAIENLRELGDVEFVESVISDFLIDAEAIMQSLHQAVDTGQLNSLREHAHALAEQFGACWRNADACRSQGN